MTTKQKVYTFKTLSELERNGVAIHFNGIAENAAEIFSFLITYGLKVDKFEFNQDEF